MILVDTSVLIDYFRCVENTASEKFDNDTDYDLISEHFPLKIWDV